MPVVRDRNIRVLIDPATIAARNAEMAREVAEAGYNNLLVISILKGSFVFAADLIRDALFQKKNDDARIFRFDR